MKMLQPQKRNSSTNTRRDSRINNTRLQQKQEVTRKSNASTKTRDNDEYKMQQQRKRGVTKTTRDYNFKRRQQ